MKFRIGDKVTVNLTKKSLIGSNQPGYIQKCYHETPLTGKVVYQNAMKDRIGVEFPFKIYNHDFKLQKMATMSNAYGRSNLNGHCAYVHEEFAELDITKPENYGKFIVDPSDYDKLPNFEITKPVGFDFSPLEKRIASYYGKSLEELQACKVNYGNNIHKELEKSLSEQPMYYAGIDPYLPIKPGFDFYNPTGGPQTKEERAAMKAAKFARVYGMEGNLGMMLLKPRRIGLTYAQETMRDYLEAWMGVREVCSNGSNLEPIDWEDPMPLHQLSALGSSYEADQMRSEYKGWRHSFNRESQRGKDIWINPQDYYNMSMGTFKPDYSDAVIASTWAALLEPMRTLHDILGLKELQPYGDEEVLLCPS